MAGAVPVSGLTMLGQALAQGAGDYANRRLSLADEQRRRGERLADVADARAYEGGQFDKLRNLQLLDEDRRRKEALEDAKNRALQANRFKMLEEAQKRGLIMAAQIGNAALEDAALTALGDQLKKEAAFSQAQPANAAAALTGLVAEQDQLQRQMAELERVLSSQPTVDPRQVQARAIAIATQNNGGKTPSREQIAEAADDATKEAEEQAFQRWFQEKQNATVRYQILASQLNANRQQQATLTGTFRVAPGAPVAPPVAMPQAAAPVRPAANPMAGFQAALNQATPPPVEVNPVAATSRAITMAPPGALPALRQARTIQMANEREALDAPLFETNARLAQTQDQLKAATMGLNPFQAVTPGPFPASPQVQGEYITRLLMRDAALQQEKQKQEAARRQAINSQLQLIRPAAPAPSAGSLLSTR